MPWLQLFIHCQKPEAHNTENALLKAGALSVTLQELIPEGASENPILEPGLNETPLWNHISTPSAIQTKLSTPLANNLKPHRITAGNSSKIKTGSANG